MAKFGTPVEGRTGEEPKDFLRMEIKDLAPRRAEIKTEATDIGFRFQIVAGSAAENQWFLPRNSKQIPSLQS